MKTKYKIVDKDGDEINTGLFKPWVDIPVQVQSVAFWPAIEPGEEDEMVITLEYQQGKVGE